MLQQTQVETVIPYYISFLRAFPSVKRLAEAPRERVLELWSGLGYYRRARHLHLAAQKVVQDFGGRFPSDYRQARSLPGIGDYTARAILSIAYNQPYSVMDGNVARVVARLAGFRGNIGQPGFRRGVRDTAERLLSRRRPGDFNQALMELGQTVCQARAPRCGACPLREWCRAYGQGNPESYPSPRPRRPTELRYLATAVIHASAPNGRPTRVALVRGLDEGLLPELWNFPAAFGSSRAEAFTRLKEKLAQVSPGGIEWKPNHVSSTPSPVVKLRHGITYRSIRVEVYDAEARDGNATHSTGAFRWFQTASIGRAAVSQLARKIGVAMGMAPVNHQRPPRRT